MARMSNPLFRHVCEVYEDQNQFLTFRNADGVVDMIVSTDGMMASVKGEIPQTAISQCVGRTLSSVVERDGIDPRAIIIRACSSGGVSSFELDRYIFPKKGAA